MKLAIDWVIHSDIYVAFVAIGLGLAAYLVYGIQLNDITPLLIIFLVTLNIYAINRQVDQEIDEVNLPERTSFVKRYGQHITIISVIGSAFSLVLAFSHSYFTGIVTALALFFGYLYSYSLFRICRLRDQFIWKNIGVGLIYGFISLITLAYFDITNEIEMLSMFMLFFINFFLISSFFDLRDVKGDMLAGIKTIPISLGEKTMHFFHMTNIDHPLSCLKCHLY